MHGCGRTQACMCYHLVSGVGTGFTDQRGRVLRWETRPGVGAEPQTWITIIGPGEHRDGFPSAAHDHVGP